MRPGRNAPENHAVEFLLRTLPAGFNEAGAKCPGERSSRSRPTSATAGFNEAGAKCPGEPALAGPVQPEKQPASMRPGRNAPENEPPRPGRLPGLPASMRPGRNAPENEAGAGRARSRSPALQ